MGKYIIPKLYKQYYIDKQDERRVLFQKIREIYRPETGLYPGSFAHITPSLYIENMIYVDNDKRISKFFSSENLTEYIRLNRAYKSEPALLGLQQDFKNNLPVKEISMDVLFSFYSGFISLHCKRYLKENGILVCNDSHGDASIATTDSDYQFIGVIKRVGDRFTISENDLHLYFQKKDRSAIDTKKVLSQMRGENFTKKGYAYIFRKII